MKSGLRWRKIKKLPHVFVSGWKKGGSSGLTKVVLIFQLNPLSEVWYDHLRLSIQRYRWHGMLARPCDHYGVTKIASIHIVSKHCCSRNIFLTFFFHQNTLQTYKDSKVCATYRRQQYAPEVCSILPRHQPLNIHQSCSSNLLRKVVFPPERKRFRTRSKTFVPVWFLKER